jgi:hypothetical protein
VTREELGLPARWSTVLGWLLFCGKTVLVEVAKFCVKPLKHKYLPRQMDYRKGMNEEFWKLFPFRDIPLRAETNIDTDNDGKSDRRREGKNVEQPIHQRSKGAG